MHVSQIINRTQTAPQHTSIDYSKRPLNSSESYTPNVTDNLTEQQRQIILATMFEPVQPPPEFMVDIVGKLFMKFKENYSFLMVTGGEYDWGRNKILEWADYFTSKNATIDELRQAYRLSKDVFKKFPPNEVQFLDLVLQNRHTDSHQALRIAIDTASKIQAGNQAEWDNVAIYESAMRIGFYTLTHEADYALNERWGKTYKAVCDELDSGATFTIPSVPLIEQQHTTVSKERAQEHLAEVMAKIGKKVAV